MSTRLVTDSTGRAAARPLTSSPGRKRALLPGVAALTRRPISAAHALPPFVSGDAAAALPTTAGSRDSRHGIFRLAQNFGQADLLSSQRFALKRSVRVGGSPTNRQACTLKFQLRFYAISQPRSFQNLKIRKRGFGRYVRRQWGRGAGGECPVYYARTMPRRPCAARPDSAAAREAAGLGLSTVIDFERSRRRVTAESIQVIGKALEKPGVEFIPANGRGSGVRLKRKPH
jgi:hypothetical protein